MAVQFFYAHAIARSLQRDPIIDNGAILNQYVQLTMAKLYIYTFSGVCVCVSIIVVSGYLHVNYLPLARGKPLWRAMDATRPIIILWACGCYVV